MSATIVCVCLIGLTHGVYSFIPISASLRRFAYVPKHQFTFPASIRQHKVSSTTTRYVPRMNADNRDSSYERIEYYDEFKSNSDMSRDSLGRVEELGIFPLGIVLNPGK
jgi:hypothetical protein